LPVPQNPAAPDICTRLQVALHIFIAGADGLLPVDTTKKHPEGYKFPNHHFAQPCQMVFTYKIHALHI